MAMEARIAALVAKAVKEVIQQPSESLDLIKVINEIGRGRLEVAKLDNQLEMERLKLEQEDRKLRREEEREAKEKDRERRLKMAEASKEQRAREKTRRVVGKIKPNDLDADMADCEECQAAFAGRKPLHTFDMLRHAETGHARRLAQLLQSQKDDGNNANPAN
jgi:hypothetical protein